MTVVIPGVSVPLLLRKRGDVYRLIRETYVQGIMFGETVECIHWCPARQSGVVAWRLQPGIWSCVIRVAGDFCSSEIRTIHSR